MKITWVTISRATTRLLGLPSLPSPREVAEGASLIWKDLTIEYTLKWCSLIFHCKVISLDLPACPSSSPAQLTTSAQHNNSVCCMNLAAQQCLMHQPCCSSRAHLTQNRIKSMFDFNSKMIYFSFMWFLIFKLDVTRTRTVFYVIWQQQLDYQKCLFWINILQK